MNLWGTPIGTEVMSMKNWEQAQGWSLKNGGVSMGQLNRVV